MGWKKAPESLPDYEKTIIFRVSEDGVSYLSTGKLERNVSPHEPLKISIFESEKSHFVTREILVSKIDIWIYAEEVTNCLKDIELETLVLILQLYEYLPGRIHTDVINEVIKRICKN